MSADRYQWLAYARGDLHAADLLAADASVPGRIACFHAHQAAEKALKAALVASSTPFRKTHDIVVLAGLAPVGLVVALADIDIIMLQSWAVDGRYPGDLPDATENETKAVVRVATEVVAAVATWIDAAT